MAAEENNKLYGLIGFPLQHSFSKGFFKDKFRDENTQATYENFPLPTLTISNFAKLWQQPNLAGLNVTIPYKQTVLPFLDDIDDKALRIGAVNVIKKLNTGKLKGFNTDYIGFKSSLNYFLSHRNLRALILGTGGASKAVEVVLQDLDLDYRLVSRTSQGANMLNYTNIDAGCLSQYHLIINTTPLGMSPHIDSFPNLPYHALTEQHFLYDLVYNPERTAFLKQGLKQKAQLKNGLDMLYKQAEAAWSIWMKDEDVDTILK